MSPTSVQLPIGVCVLPVPPHNAARTVTHPEYIHEILGHAGLCYAPVPFPELPGALPHLQILVTVGDAALPEPLQQQLRAWVEQGGAWLALGGVCGVPSLFGVDPEPPAYSSWGAGASTLGEGYLKPQARAHPILAHLKMPLHYFNGIPVRPARGRVLGKVLDAHQHPTSRIAVAELVSGNGLCVLVAPDVTGTVVRIQQGVAITRDRVPAPDGTAPCCDNVLKSDDGSVLDWIFDREPVDGVPGLNAFLQPVADQWRELLLRGIFYLATQLDVAVPVLWLYPRNLPALGHLSHDTDGNEPDKARLLLDKLKEADIRSTWCTVLPGYAPEIMQAVRAAGHEFATHYDAMSDGMVWSEEAFDAQWRELSNLFGGERPITNKNHYLRWEGDTEFFEWCVRRGIQLDQSKGPSKTGEAGFNFGSCHPYFPVTPQGHLLDVLELPTMTQDLIVFVPIPWVTPVLEATLRHHGIMHFLFHPAHIDKPGVAEALLSTVARARACGMEWWTARQINTWERARRQVRWTRYVRSNAGMQAALTTHASLPEATVLWLTAKNGTARVDGRNAQAALTQRWGFSFQAVVFDATAGEHTLELNE